MHMAHLGVEMELLVAHEVYLGLRLNLHFCLYVGGVHGVFAPLVEVGCPETVAQHAESGVGQ